MTTTQSSDNQFQSNEPCRLLDQPPELWSKIGRLVVDSEELAFRSRLMPHNPDMGFPERPLLPAAPPVAQTCKALRYELLPYFLKTRIQINCQNRDTARSLRRMAQWLAAVDRAERSQIRGVKVIVKAGRGSLAHPWERVDKIWREEYGLDFEAVQFEIVAHPWAPLPAVIEDLAYYDVVYEIRFS